MVKSQPEFLFATSQELHVERRIVGNQHGIFGELVKSPQRIDDFRCMCHHGFGDAMNLGR